MVTFGSFQSNLAIHEGNVEHMYLDAKRLVTVGIGHLLLYDALDKIPFVKRDRPAEKASLAQKQTEFEKVTAATTPKYITGGENKWYTDNITLTLLSEDVNNCFEDDVKKAEIDIKTLLPNYYTYPATARFAMLDMVFNLGLGGFKKFKKLSRDIKKRDFTSAAKHSHRKPPVPESRNDYVKRLFLIAAEEEKQCPRKDTVHEQSLSIGQEISSKLMPKQHLVNSHTPKRTKQTVLQTPDNKLIQHTASIRDSIKFPTGTIPFKGHTLAKPGHGATLYRNGATR